MGRVVQCGRKEAILSTSTVPPELEVPLYTVAEAARIIDVHASTLGTWVKGYARSSRDKSPVIGLPLIAHIEPARPHEPTIPFVGLAEALVLAAVRRAGVPMQRVRPALDQLQRTIGLSHALASEKLYTDGAELLFDFAASDAGSRIGDLVVVRSGQRVFTDVVQDYLKRIEYGPGGYARLIHLPAYEHAHVVADPTRSFGSPIFERGGARVDDVMERFWAGDSLDDVSAEFGVPLEELEDVVRVASRRAA